MNFGSKVRSFLTKLCRCNKFRYQRLPQDYISDDDNGDSVGGVPRIYVSVTVGEEGKSYDVPLMYLSQPWFQQMVIQPMAVGENLETDLGRPIAVDCSSEMFELFLELLSFKWDLDEGNYLMFLKKFKKWSGATDEYSSSGNAEFRRSDEMGISSSDSTTARS